MASPTDTCGNQSDGEEPTATEEVAAVEEVEVAAGGGSGSMSVLDALKGVLKTALIHDGLARGLRECSKALDRRQAHMCVLSEACEEEAYKKLVVALCGEHKIPLIKVPDGKQLGEWAGLCRFCSSNIGGCYDGTLTPSFSFRQARSIARATPAKSSIARAWWSRIGARSRRSAPSCSTTSRPSSRLLSTRPPRTTSITTLYESRTVEHGMGGGMGRGGPRRAPCAGLWGWLLLYPDPTRNQSAGQDGRNTEGRGCFSLQKYTSEAASSSLVAPFVQCHPLAHAIRTSPNSPPSNVTYLAHAILGHRNSHAPQPPVSPSNVISSGRLLAGSKYKPLIWPSLRLKLT